MKLTPEKANAFLAALATCGNVSKSCVAADISRTIAYEWRKLHPEFAVAWEDAAKMGVEGMEDEARRRAYDGCDKPVFHNGVECGAVREYSDTLMIFLLKAHAPEKYRERSSVELNASVAISTITDEERAAGLHDLLLKSAARVAEPLDGSDLV